MNHQNWIGCNSVLQFHPTPHPLHRSLMQPDTWIKHSEPVILIHILCIMASTTPVVCYGLWMVHAFLCIGWLPNPTATKRRVFGEFIKFWKRKLWRIPKTSVPLWKQHQQIIWNAKLWGGMWVREHLEVSIIHLPLLFLSSVSVSFICPQGHQHIARRASLCDLLYHSLNYPQSTHVSNPGRRKDK